MRNVIWKVWNNSPIMPGPIKDFAALAGLRKDLKAQEEARTLAAAEAARKAKREREEADLFRHSIGNVAILPGPDKKTHEKPRPSTQARQHMADEQAALMESISDEFTYDTLLDTDASLSFARNGISQDTLHKLRRGHWVIQRELDLHGLRTDQAREALGEFLRDVRRNGLRCVRVIHGKGLGSVNREPVLKNKVRNWLIQKDEVLAFCQATPADGGSGALIVLLKSQSRNL
jgi:DNA-nicking Smr family endonuclease